MSLVHIDYNLVKLLLGNLPQGKKTTDFMLSYRCAKWNTRSSPILMKSSCCLTYDSSFWLSMIFWYKSYLIPSPQTWENIFPAINFAASDALFPSGYYTLNMSMPKIGLSLAFSIVIRSLYLKCCINQQSSGPSSSLCIVNSMFKYVS